MEELPAPSPFGMSLPEFQRYAADAVEWLTDYYRRVDSFPVVSKLQPGDVVRSIPNAPPLQGEPFENILGDLNQKVLPGVTHWQSPRFFAYFPSNISGPSVIAELISAGLGLQGMLWKTSPVATELEMVVMDWLVQALGLPSEFLFENDGGGVIQDTASSAVLCAMVAAREQATDGASNEMGVPRGMTAYISEHTHSSVEKAGMICGIGRNNIRKIECDSSFGMIAEKLDATIQSDLAAGLTPFFVCSTIGTTSTLAIDPVEDIGQICKRYNLWHHVDAAMLGTAALCPELRSIHDGISTADSYNFNPHKWMLTNLDCSCLFLRDRNALIRSLSINPAYLENPESDSGRVVDYRDWQVPLGRRFRALKLWFVLRFYGLEGLRLHVRRHIALAQSLATRLGELPTIQVVGEHPFNLVCFRHKQGENRTREMLSQINGSGLGYVTPTVIGDSFVIRICLGQVQTQQEHIDDLVDLVKDLS